MDDIPQAKWSKDSDDTSSVGLDDSKGYIDRYIEKLSHVLYEEIIISLSNYKDEINNITLVSSILEKIDYKIDRLNDLKEEILKELK